MLYAISTLRECGAALDGRIQPLTLVPMKRREAKGGSACCEQGRLGRGGIGCSGGADQRGYGIATSRAISLCASRALENRAHVGCRASGERFRTDWCELASNWLRTEAGSGVQKHHFFFSGGAQSKRAIDPDGWEARAAARKTQRGAGSVLVSRSTGECNRKRIWQRKKQNARRFWESCKREGIPLEWEILQKGRPRACREEERWAESPWLVANACKLRAKRHVLRCCPGLAWRFAFYPRKASRLCFMVPVCSPWRMGRTNTVDLPKSARLQRGSTHTGLWKCSPAERV